MLNTFRFFVFYLCFYLFSVSVYLLNCAVLVVVGYKCTGEANVVPTEGDFPVVYVLQHLKGLCILKTITVASKPDFIFYYCFTCQTSKCIGLESLNAVDPLEDCFDCHKL